MDYNAFVIFIGLFSKLLRLLLNVIEAKGQSSPQIFGVFWILMDFAKVFWVIFKVTKVTAKCYIGQRPKLSAGARSKSA